MTSAVTSDARLVQHSSHPDARTPWIPDNAYLKRIIRKECPYPSSYPGTVIKTCDKISIKAKNAPLRRYHFIVHAVEKIIFQSNKYIKIGTGSVLSGDTVLLRAPVVMIYDDRKSPVRTSLITKILQIEAEMLIVDGADIVGKQFNFHVLDFCFYHSTPETQSLRLKLRKAFKSDAAAQPAAKQKAPLSAISEDGKKDE